MARRAFSVPLRAVAIATALLSLLAASALANSLSGSMGTGAKFPGRTLVLSAPSGVPVSVPRIYVSENGKPVDHLSVTPMAAANPGDFGIVLVIEQSERMSGTPLATAMSAGRAIAAQRTGRQKLGVITFASTPSVVLPLTSNPRRIGRALAKTPRARSGAGPLTAVMAGLKQLALAHVTNGAVILLSDGGATAPTKLTPASVGAAAVARHVEVFTVGVRDSAFTSGGLRRLAQRGNGKFVAPRSARLPYVFTHLSTALPQSYLLRYQSILPGSQPVAVTVHVDGVSTPLQVSYNAPARPSSSSTTSSGASPSGGSSSSGSPSSAASSGAAASGAESPGANKSPGAKSGATKGSSSAVPGVVSLGGAVPSSLLPATGGLSSILSHQSSVPAPAGTRRPRKARHVPGHRVVVPPPKSVASAPGWVRTAPRHSFWASSLGVLAIAGGCALLIALALGVLLWRRPTRQAVRQRVGTFGLDSSVAHPTTASLTPDAGGAVAKLLTRRRWWPAFAQQVETARMRPPLALIKRSAVISVVAALLLTVVSGSPIFGILLLLVAPMVLRAWVKRGARRQQRFFNEQLPSHLQDLAGAMRGGRSFVGAIAAMVDSATEPTRGEFDRALSDERLGLPLEDTLEAIGDRMAAKDMDQIALIARLNRNSGSNVSEALERVAESSRERADLRREMKALTGQARMSAYVLTGMPPALLGALTVIAPQYQRPLFHTTVGIVLLFVAGGMLAAGWKVMNKIINVEV